MSKHSQERRETEYRRAKSPEAKREVIARSLAAHQRLQRFRARRMRAATPGL
jgi:hypothetical protein